MDKPKKLKKRVIKALRFFKVNILDNPFWFIIFLVVISLGLCYRAVMINYSITNDEGGYSFIAKKILDGAIPYKDYFDHKPPGVYYAFALAFLLFGKSLFTARMLVFAVNVCTAVTIFFVGRALKKPAVGQLASVLFLFAALTPVYIGYLALTEPFVMLFSTLSILLYIKSDDGAKTKMVLLSGVALGLATLFKQSAFPLLVAFYVFFLLGFRLKENRTAAYFKHRVWNGAVIGIGMAIVWAPVIAYFAIKGALGDMIYCVFMFNEEYFAYSHFTDATRTLIWDRFMIYQFVFVIGIIAMAIAIIRYIAVKKYDYPLLLFLFFVCLLPQLAYFHFIQYFLTFLPVLCLLAAGTTMEIWMFMKYRPENEPTPVKSALKKEPLQTAKVLLVFLVAMMVYTSAINIQNSYPPTRGQGVSALEIYISNHTSPGEKIFIFGTPYYYFVLDRDPPSRHFYIYAWTASEDVQREMIEGLEKYHVKYVIVMKSMLYSNGNPKLAYTLWNYIASNYQYEQTIGSVDIYIRSAV